MLIQSVLFLSYYLENFLLRTAKFSSKRILKKEPFLILIALPKTVCALTMIDIGIFIPISFTITFYGEFLLFKSCWMIV